MSTEKGEGRWGETTSAYPTPLATYEDVVRSPDLFMDTLKKLHLSMATKFMIPIVGGTDLDLHRLFVEVTSRGGIAKVLNDKKWKQVTSVFKFPPSATNASFILRKYYISLIYHYEQIYLFNAKCWSRSPLSLAPPKSQTEASGCQVVDGVIDGKFESGYLVSVKIGCEELKGVLYQVSGGGRGGRRKRRKKWEMRKRDPAHPKPNRSGYNFFFAEQHARLKPHYHGRDREISRIIGESWNKLQQPQRRVYEEKAVKDKERYKMEMEVYRERLRRGEIMTDIVNSSSSNNEMMMMIDNNDSSDYCQLKNVNVEVMADEAPFQCENAAAVLVQHENVDESLPSL